MKIILSILTIVLHGVFSLSSLAQDKNNELEIYDDWRLSKEKDGIKIFTRWIDAEEGRKTRQLHAIMTTEASVTSGVLAIVDPALVVLWLNRAKEYYHYDHRDNFNWYAYTEFKVPWPLKNQDLVTENNMHHDQASGKVLITLSGVDNRLPEKDGVQRIPGFEGSWELTPVGNGRIRIDYFILTKAKPVLPRWLTDPIIEYGLWSSFDELREVIQDNEKKNVSLPFRLR